MGIQEIVTDGQLLIASLVALAAGIVSFLSPCVLPLVPGYLAYVSGVAGLTPTAPSRGAASSGVASSGVGATGVGVTGQTASEMAAATETATALAGQRRSERAARRRVVLGSLLFVLGFTLIFVLMMALAGSVGIWLVQWERVITRVMGVLVIVMGLVFMGVFGGMQRTAKLKMKPKVGLAGAPLLGAVFAIGWTPCIGPTLAVIATLTIQSGTVSRGAWLALLYSLGLGLPFVLAAFGFGWMTSATTFFKRHIRVINLIGGALLVVIGLLMVTGLWSMMMYALQAVIPGYVPAI